MRPHVESDAAVALGTLVLIVRAAEVDYELFMRSPR
jgi:hypothetical protein